MPEATQQFNNSPANFNQNSIIFHKRERKLDAKSLLRVVILLGSLKFVAFQLL